MPVRDRQLFVIGFAGFALLVHGAARLLQVQSALWWNVEPWLLLVLLLVLLSLLVHRERIAERRTGSGEAAVSARFSFRELAWPVILGVIGSLASSALIIKWSARALGVVPGTRAANAIAVSVMAVTLFVLGLASPRMVRGQHVQQSLVERVGLSALLAAVGAAWWWILVT